jgi:hypothetical protein
MFKFILHSTLVTGSTVLAYTFVESMGPIPEIDINIENSAKLLVLYNNGNYPLEITKFSYRQKNDDTEQTFLSVDINKGYVTSKKLTFYPLPRSLGARSSKSILKTKVILTKKESETLNDILDDIEIKFTYKTLFGDREYIKPIK